MIALFTNWRIWVFIGLLGAIAGAGYEGYRSGKNTIQVQFDAYKIGVQDEVIKQSKIALAKQQDLQTQIEKAQNDAVQREKILQNNIISLTHTNDGLRDQLNTINSELSTATDNAVRNYAITANGIIAESTARYSEVAKQLDQCTNDLKTLSDAFPK